MEYPELRKQAINQYDKWKPTVVICEDKASGQSLIQDLKNGTKIPIVPIKPESDKLTRMSAQSGFVEAGKLLLPSRASWLVDYETELTRFPYAKHDDCVDATSQFLKYMKRPKYKISQGLQFWK
jgi:predicted phage terminase large subunit-like protein